MTTLFDMRMRLGPELHVRPADHRPGSLRREIEETIEALMAVLDGMSGDADLEDDGSSEPSLGWLTSGGHSWRDGNVDLEEAQTRAASSL